MAKQKKTTASTMQSFLQDLLAGSMASVVSKTAMAPVERCGEHAELVPFLSHVHPTRDWYLPRERSTDFSWNAHPSSESYYHFVVHHSCLVLGQYLSLAGWCQLLTHDARAAESLPTFGLCIAPAAPGSNFFCSSSGYTLTFLERNSIEVCGTVL